MGEWKQRGARQKKGRQGGVPGMSRQKRDGVNEETEKRCEEFFAALRASTVRPLLLLDYDGTLAAFRVDRFRARPWAGVSAQLAQIQTQAWTRMAVITGRPPEEIEPMLGLQPPLEVWGLHGAERLYPDGRRELEGIPSEARVALDRVRAALQQDSLGGLYEDKANAAVLHWRGFTPRQARAIEERALAVFEPLARLEGLRLLRFDGGVELRGGRDKGGAIAAIVAEEAKGAPVAYLGDDLSDEAAFGAVNALTAPHLSVLVRRQQRVSAAVAWLRPPAELRTFFARWIESCAGGR